MAIAAGVVIAIGLVGGYYMILNPAFENICLNQIFKESVSPDESKKFVVFQRSCGATTGFSTHASLISADASLP
ncbi:MAG TPA: hypothetical protein VKR81_04015, partial [Candidatus Binatia bacterium]|nr:hypothetical protein [Candidatus Binatia bacterium]